MQTAEHFRKAGLLTQARTIERGGSVWLRKYTRMVSAWGSELKLHQRFLDEAIASDIEHEHDPQQSPPNPIRFLDQCVAVTSLSPNPAKQARQKLCIQSWRDIGLQIISVNTTSEISIFKSQISEVNFVTCDHLTTEYDRPTQNISTLIAAGLLTKLPFLLINSDIEIHGDPQLLSDALANPNKLTIGVRYNHAAGESRDSAIFERWGLDAFLMTPAMAATIPPLPFGIGKPVWDYWLPQHFRALGLEFHWIKKPFFFHERHPLAWSQAEWNLGATWMEQHYGVELIHDSATYRRSL